MNGRTILGAVAGTLLVAGASLVLLEPGARAATGPATVEVDDPPAAMLALPEAGSEATEVPALERRTHPRPTLANPGPRSPLASALTVVPSPPLEILEPSPPRLTDAAGGIRFEVPSLEAVRLPAPDGPGPAAGESGSCRGTEASFVV